MPSQPNRRRSRLAPRRKESPVAAQPEALAKPKASSKNTAAKPPKKTVAAQPAARPAQTASPRRKTRAGKNPAVSRAAKPVAASTTPLLKVIPLGGMREIGKNMTVYEYGDEMIIVDCGIAFPEDDMPGIDVVIPDFSYVMQNKHKLKGIFLTHGHEDHIGALPWLCRDIHVPIYGNQLTIELVRLKL